MMGSNVSTTLLVVLMLIFSFLTFFSISADEFDLDPYTPAGLWDDLSYTFSFTEPSFHEKMVHDTVYTTIDMSGCMAIGERAGEPSMPVKFVKLLLPPMEKVKDISVFGVPVEIDTGDINLLEKPVLPYQNPVPIGSEPLEPFAFDTGVYSSLDNYPSSLYSEQHVGYCRGYAILSLALNPVHYVPGEGKLFYYPELTIDIKLEEKEQINQFYRNNLDDEEWVKNLVNNPEIASTYTGEGIGTFEYLNGLCDPSDDYDYVIITTTENNLNHWVTSSNTPYNWTSLMDKHYSEDSLNCTLVTMQEILSCSDYYNSTALFNDTPARIREFCKDAYQDWNTSYIFIGGDDELIPAREMKYYVEDHVDSDIYWNHLDNSFNNDNDSYWGEAGDSGFDLYAEMYIGRITCDEPQDVSNWMNKSFYYADSLFEDYLENAAFYGGNTGWNAKGDDFIEYSAIKGTSNWLGPSPGAHGTYPSWLGFQYGFETWNTHNPSLEYNLSVKWTAESDVNSGWQGGSDSAAITGFRNEINNNNCTLISGIAHANEDMSLDVAKADWESQYHNTKPFFIHDYGCHCGDMDAADDGILHSMLFHSDTELAFACVYNTCYGWGSLSDTNSSSALQQKLFWDYMFDTTNNSGNYSNWQLGKAMAYSKDSMAPTINWNYSGAPESWRAIIQGCLLFGDPAQRIKPPEVFEHNVGVQTVGLSVSSHVKTNELIYVNATVYNSGENDETDVNVSFRVNGTEVDSTIITSFKNQTTHDVSFTWTPSAGLYTITINITIPGITEGSYTDNERNETITVGVKNIDTSELFNTIQDAINDSDTLDSHSILVPSGAYNENVTINKNITLTGAAKTTTIIEGNGSTDYVIHIQNRNYVNITKFTIKNGTYGIYINNSSNITITYTNISNNNLTGLYLQSSNNINITNNHIYNNSWGINLTSYSHDNRFIENEIINNNIGLTIDTNNHNNSIYHNNFSNTQNAFDNGTNNQWDNGNTSASRHRGGNWWDDYTGSDSNSDGIGDTPYDVPGDNHSQDRYPLVGPWSGSLSGTIYVDDDNTAGPWDGTQSHPFISIQDGIDDAFTGDLIFVYNGTYNENIKIDKSVNITGEDKNSTIIDGSGSGTVVLISANWVNISNFTIEKSGDLYASSSDWMNISNLSSKFDNYCAGIQISSNYNNISNNIIQNTSFGILEIDEAGLTNNKIYKNTLQNIYCDIILGYSTNDIIVNNYISNISSIGAGIYLYYTSSSYVFSNHISNNTGGYGILTSSSSNSIISQNEIIDTGAGIHCWYLTDSDIKYNIISNSSDDALYILDSSNNNIYCNNITNSSSYGIYLFWSQNNFIFYNNLINNSNYAYDAYSNTWYNTTFSEGNYWSDYTGSDSNGDGIGDTPYDISGGSNQDLYPLMGPWGKRPNQPSCIQPSDGATSVSTSPTLQVQVTDPNNDTMDVSFYDASDDSLIATEINVENGNNTSTTWSSRSSSTTYSWYVIVTDGTYLTKSVTWSFTTASSGGNGGNPPPSGGGLPTNNEIKTTAPDKPIITGPAEGYLDVSYTYTANTTDPDENSLRYNFDWGDETNTGWTTPSVESGDSVSKSHSWNSTGNYKVKVKAQDAVDQEESEWSDVLNITISEYIDTGLPTKPTTPTGPSYGVTNISYSYKTTSTDPDNDRIKYRFDWGDGTCSDWSSFVNSGTSITISHKWMCLGNYSIKSQARDANNATSPWSDPLDIKIELDSDGDIHQADKGECFVNIDDVTF